MPEIYFSLAWSLSKTKDYEGAANAYRECLNLDATFPFARNNLGWEFIRLAKYDEAIKVLREAVKLRHDGEFPFWNLAKALRKLGRLREAIEVLKQITRRGVITKQARNQINDLEAQIRENENGRSPQHLELSAEQAQPEMGKNGPTDVAVDVADILDGESGKEHELKLSQKPKSAGIFQRKRLSQPFTREQILEEMLEEMILRGQRAFDRQLRIYESEEGLYGRQLAIANIGRIDLLVEDVETQDLIVIELKRNKTDDEVVGQTLRYVGWVRENLAKPGQNVRGIICVHKATEKLRLAASTVSEIQVFAYVMSFERI